jgi:6-phosphogluconolactonase
MSYLFVGSYAPAEAEGIHLYQFQAEGDGLLERVNGYAGVANPSFLTVDAARRRLFAVSETANGAVVSLRYDVETGAIEEVNRQLTQGDDPCHLITDPTGQWLLLVNYSSGNVNVYPIAADGSLGTLSDQVQHVGHSVNPDRQESPHPHSIHNIPGTSFYLVPDLGLDQLVIYKLDSDHGKLNQVSVTNTAPGSGPRHAAFHPSEPYVYVIYELTSEAEVFEINRAEGTLTSVQKLTTLPAGLEGDSWCAEIAMADSGAHVYGSNRGDDSLVVYNLETPSQLYPVGWSSTKGNFPRHFTIVPNEPYVLAANQNSDNMVVMKLNEQGIPVATGQEVQITKPVCLKFG